MWKDIEIKNAITKFQQQGNNFEKIRETLSQFIYHFPAIGFDVYDEDIKGDFYLYINDRLKSILAKYRVQEKALFKTYFYLVLRRYYLNFIQSRKTPSYTTGVDENYLTFDEDDFLEKKVKLEKISLIFSSLPPKYRLILKLRCPDFLLPEDLHAIGKEFNKDPAKLIAKMDIILNDIARKEKKRSKNSAAGLSSPVPVASPRAIAGFLDVRPNLVSKWLVQIRKTLEGAVPNVS
jgi:RNA polymerase sigma factor (sigma-70 family)